MLAEVLFGPVGPGTTVDNLNNCGTKPGKSGVALVKTGERIKPRSPLASYATAVIILSLTSCGPLAVPQRTDMFVS